MGSAVTLTEEEKRTLVCGVCGKPAKSEHGLKIHKNRVCSYVPVSTVKEDEVKEEVQEESQEETEQVLDEIEPPFEVVEDKPEPEPVKAPVVEAPVESKADDTSLDLLGIKEIPVGARVLLDGSGSFWKKDPSTSGFVAENATNVVCRVVNKWMQGEWSYLQLDDLSSDDEWSCLESAVVSGDIQLISLRDPAPVEEIAAPIPSPPRPPEVIDPSELRSYKSACELYVTARDAKSAATAEYKMVNENTRPTILSFLDKYGRESKYGKGDQKLTEAGYDVHYTMEDPKKVVARDEGAILKWLLENGMTFAIKEALDLEEWSKLVDSGQVPKSFLRKVEKVEELPPQRRLRVFKIED